MLLQHNLNNLLLVLQPIHKCVKTDSSIKTFKNKKRYMLLIKWIHYNFVCLIKEKEKLITLS